MKLNKLYLIFALSLFLPISVLAVATQQGVHEPGTGLENPEEKFAQGESVLDGEEMQAQVVTVSTDSDVEVVVMNQNQNKQGSDMTNGNTDGVGIKTQAQEQNQIHEVGIGIENPELKEMNQEQNQIQANKDDANQNKKGNSRSLERRSEVANAVQEMLGVATRNGGIGEQIREVAQNQNQLQNNIENSLEKVQNQNKFMKFLIGPNYNEINGVKINLENHNQKLEELKKIKDEVSEEDKILLESQIEKLEQIVEEVNLEIQAQEKFFNLFGWLKRLF